MLIGKESGRNKEGLENQRSHRLVGDNAE